MATTPDKTTPDEKALLKRYLQEGRDAVLWKLYDLSEYDMRRPMTSTGTNLLGVVKHLANVEAGYLCDSFGRPVGGPEPWTLDFDADPNADMYATAKEAHETIVERYLTVGAHADATIDELPLGTLGRVAWWPEDRARTTLFHLVVRVATETHHHAGHADIVREMIDGRVGYLEGKDQLATDLDDEWAGYVERLEAIAQQFR